MTLVFIALGSLVILLLLGRTGDALRNRRLAEAWDLTLAPPNQELIGYLRLRVGEHRLGIDVCRRALRRRDAERLRRAVEIVEGFAPGLGEGLEAMRTIGRTVSAVVPLPPVPALSWRAWRLRGICGLALLAHALLVAAAERLRLRAWLLGRALALSVRWLRRSSDRVAAQRREWTRVEDRLHDLTIVGDEAEVTYERIVRSLDAVGRIALA